MEEEASEKLIDVDGERPDDAAVPIVLPPV
jgi:hypothetical protein